MPGMIRSHQISIQDHRLYYLHMAASHGSMRSAADLLGVAPSSISRHIGQLERDLKMDLIVKGLHKTRLTEAGQALMDYYNNRVQDYEALLNRLFELRSKKVRTLKIAIGFGLMIRPLMSAIHAIIAQHEDTAVDVITASSFEVQRLVQEGSAQIGILIDTPGDVRSRVQISLDHPIRLICHPDHPLATVENLDLATIAGHRLVLPAGGFRLTEIIHAVFSEEGCALDPVLTANALEPIVGAVKDRVGVSLLPEIMVADEVKRGDIVARDIDCLPFQSTKLHLITPFAQPLPPAGLELLANLNHLLRSF